MISFYVFVLFNIVDWKLLKIQPIFFRFHYFFLRFEIPSSFFFAGVRWDIGWSIGLTPLVINGDGDGILDCIIFFLGLEMILKSPELLNEGELILLGIEYFRRGGGDIKTNAEIFWYTQIARSWRMRKKGRRKTNGYCFFLFVLLLYVWNEWLNCSIFFFLLRRE